MPYSTVRYGTLLYSNVPAVINDGSHHGGLLQSFLVHATLNPPFSLDPFVTRRVPPWLLQFWKVQSATSTSHPIVLPAKPQVSWAQLKHLYEYVCEVRVHGSKENKMIITEKIDSEIVIN